ncbi:ABC transporter permease [Candidatus Poriferisodalis sp.]|uniref:ABC transporter permease n=1 Tax=Candidatus Poriferisodalis sp. TaxID=3101277 RepID=UPI003B02465C
MTSAGLPRRRRAVAAFGWTAAAVPPIAFMAVFFAYPVLTVVADGFAGLGEVLGRPAIRGVLWFTVWQAVVSTVLTLAVGVPAAAAWARLRPRSRRIVRAVVTVPFVLPTVVVAGAFEAVFERFGLRGGALSLRHSVWAILAAHVFFNYAVVVRTVGSWWTGLDGRNVDAAAVLGATPLRAFRYVTWPLLRPAVAVAATVTFLFSFTSFGVILVLGGPARATVETEIYRYAITRLDFATASALALCQLAAVAALVALAGVVERRRASVRRAPRSAAPQRHRGVIAVNAALGLILLGAPLMSLVERAFATGDGYGVANFTALARRVQLLPATALEALGHSLGFAAIAALIAAVVGALASSVIVGGRTVGNRRLRATAPIEACAGETDEAESQAGCYRSRRPRRALGRPSRRLRRRGGLRIVLDIGSTLPLGVSAVTVGLGMLLALDVPPLDFRTAWWIIPVAHALVGMPFVVRTLVPTLRSIDHRLREAASVLGATPLRARREVDVPIASRALAVGAAFAFAVSLGEFGATAFLPRRPDTLTAPLALYRLLGTPGAALRGQAMALAVVLMVVTAASVLVIEGMRRTDESLF